MKIYRHIRILLLALVALTAASVAYESADDHASENISMHDILQSVHIQHGTAFSAAEQEMSVPRNQTFSSSPRQHSSGKRTSGFGSPEMNPKNGSSISKPMSFSYKASLNRYSTGICGDACRIYYLMKLII